MKIIYKVILIILFLQLVPIVYGADVTVNKKLSTNFIKYKSGELVTVNLEITNNRNEKIEGVLTDIFPRYAEVLDKEVDKTSFTPAVFWNTSLNTGETKNFSYRLRLDGVPLSAEGYVNETLPSAVLNINSELYQSNSVWVYISNIKPPPEKCNYNFKCEPKLGENSKTCPQDCPTSGKDNYCDAIKDGICDPDCPSGADPDCVEGKFNAWFYVYITIAVVAFTTLVILSIIKRRQSFANLSQKWK